MNHVISPNGESTVVKNLGWLLRHAAEVAQIEVIAYSLPTGNKQGVMLASMNDGRIFRAEWESLRICNEWLDRPCLRGIPLSWCGMTSYRGTEITCGWRATFPIA